MPPTYSLLSPPPVSPTHENQVEVSMFTPRAQGPGLASLSKALDGPEVSNSNFPTGVLGHFDSGEQVD